MAKRRRNPARSSKGHVSFARAGDAPYRGGDFKPVRAKGGELAMLREPRSAIREMPLTFLVGGILAGLFGGWLLTKSMA